MDPTYIPQFSSMYSSACMDFFSGFRHCITISGLASGEVSYHRYTGVRDSSTPALLGSFRVTCLNRHFPRSGCTSRASLVSDIANICGLRHMSRLHHFFPGCNCPPYPIRLVFRLHCSLSSPIYTFNALPVSISVIPRSASSSVL